MKSRLAVPSSGAMALVVCALGFGCDGGQASNQGFDAPPQSEPTEPTEEAWLEVTSVTPLDALPTDETLVGVTVDPQGANRFVLSEESGLYAIGDDGVTLVFDTTDLPSSEFMPELPFTDVVALSSKRFALTAKNEGYLLDIEDQSLTRFFCYLPDVDPGAPVAGQQSISQELMAQGIDVYQITQAVTYNANLGLLFAYPITVGSADGFIYGAEIGVFSDVTGEPVNWTVVQGGELATAGATGMIADDYGVLTLSRGAELYGYAGSGSPALLGSLEPHGVGEITGLAAVPGTDHLLVLDGQLRQLVELAPAN